MTARTSAAARAATALCGVAAAIVAACDDSTNPVPYAPYTGVDVPTALAVGTGGCGPEAGTLYYATLVATPASASGDAGCTALPEPASVVAASWTACFTPNAAFELDASGPVDVWVLSYPGLPPSNVACTDPSCAITPGSSPELVALLADQASAATRAAQTLKCTAIPETNQHPDAYGCLPCSGASAGSTGGADAGDDGGDG